VKRVSIVGSSGHCHLESQSKLDVFVGGVVEPDERSIGWQPGFELDAKSVCQPIGVGVVRSHLADVVDISVTEADRSQRLDIVGRDILWPCGEFLDESQHRNPSIVDCCGPPIPFDGGE
jgi:hypothetical protein